MKAKLSATALAAVVALLALGIDESRAQTIRLTIGAGHPVTALWNKTVKDHFMPLVSDRVAKETKYKIEWTEAWGGTICKLGECLEATESGLIDIANFQTVFDPAKMMAANFSAFAPFSSMDARIVGKAAMMVYERSEPLRKLYERYNQIAIAPGVTGNYGLTTTFVWEKFQDLRGRKIAAAGPNIPWLLGSNAVGVQSNLNEGYTSLQTGVYDSWLIFAEPVRSFKLFEVTKQFTSVGFGNQVFAVLTVNKDTWRRLPPEVQKIIMEAGRSWNAYMAQATYDVERDVLDFLRKQPGYAVRELPQEERVKWAKALPNLAKQRYGEIQKAGQPGEVIYTFVKALKELGVELPRDWEAER